MSAPEPIPLVDVTAQNAHVRSELVEALQDMLLTSDYGTGAAAERFEAELAEFVGTREAVGVGSGTAALDLLLRACGISHGDEVILPANTFFATAEAVVSAGAVPVLVDPDLDTANVSAEQMDAAIGPRTAAIIGVHLYGQPVDVAGYRRVAEHHGVQFLEDAAQALGAETDAGRAGSLGRGAGFSFYPGKNLGALGQAGAVTTDDAQIARSVRSLRSHGETTRYVHGEMGFNERIDGLQAAFLSHKLPFVTKWQAQRAAAVERYDELLDSVEGCTRIMTRPGVTSAHHLYVVRVPHRDAVLDDLRANGIGAAVHYPVPIHLQPAWGGRALPHALPHAEQLATEILSLPLFPEITDEQIERCATGLIDTLSRQTPHRSGGTS